MFSTLHAMAKQFFFFFGVNQGIPGFAQTNSRPGWQGLSKRPAANEERDRTPDLVSDESAPNRSARTSWVGKAVDCTLEISLMINRLYFL